MPADTLFAGQEEISREIARSVRAVDPVSIAPIAPATRFSDGARKLSAGITLAGSAHRGRDRKEHSSLGRGGSRVSAIRDGMGRAGECPLCAGANGNHPVRKAFPEIKSCVDRASEIEDLPETRTALAYYHLLYEHDWNAAETALVRALAIDPGCQLALGAYAQLLAAVGKHEDAVAMMRRACDLASVFRVYRSRVGMGVVLRRRL